VPLSPHDAAGLAARAALEGGLLPEAPDGLVREAHVDLVRVRVRVRARARVRVTVEVRVRVRVRVEVRARARARGGLGLVFLNG
jgi:hypothetical protein